MNEISMSQGWQFIHAYLVSEGGTRKWANPTIGEKPKQLREWRKSAKPYIVEED